MDQRELVRRAAAGEHAAFDGLVRFASNRLYGIAYRILRDQYLAEDTLQQALISIRCWASGSSAWWQSRERP